MITAPLYNRGGFARTFAELVTVLRVADCRMGKQAPQLAQMTPL